MIESLHCKISSIPLLLSVSTSKQSPHKFVFEHPLCRNLFSNIIYLEVSSQTSFIYKFVLKHPLSVGLFQNILYL